MGLFQLSHDHQLRLCMVGVTAVCRRNGMEREGHGGGAWNHFLNVQLFLCLFLTFLGVMR